MAAPLERMRWLSWSLRALLYGPRFSNPFTRIKGLPNLDSFQYLALAPGTLITFLTPIIVSFACSVVLHTPFTRRELCAGLVSLGGIVLVAQPWATSLPNTGSVPVPDVSSAQRLAAVGMALLGCLGGSTAYTAIRVIGSRAHALISVTYYAMLCTILSSLCLVFLPSVPFRIPSTVAEWGLMLGLGLSGFALQFMLTAGLQADKTSRATNMMYSEVVFTLILDWLIWGVVPGWVTWIGGLLVCGSTVFVAVTNENSKPESRGVGNEEDEYGVVASRDTDEQDS